MWHELEAQRGEELGIRSHGCVRPGRDRSPLAWGRGPSLHGLAAKLPLAASSQALHAAHGQLLPPPLPPPPLPASSGLLTLYPALWSGGRGAGPSPAQVPEPGALIPTLSSDFSTFKHLWKQVAQNLDRFRTFPRLAGGKGPLPSRGRRGRGGAGGLCRGGELQPGAPALAGPGVVQRTSGSECAFLIHSSCSKEIAVCAEVLFGGGDARVMRDRDPAVTSFCSSRGRRQ